MRFLFSAHPAVGHLQPVAAVARELGRRGHDVRIATASSFCTQVRELGLEPIAVGLDWSRADPELAFPGLAAAEPSERYGWILRHVYTGKAARQTAVELLTAFRSWRPDVVIHQQMELGSMLAAQLRGIPHASYGFGQGLLASDRRIAGPELAPLRAELGLDPDPDFVSGFRFLRLEFAPPSYLAPDALRAATAHHIRPEIVEYRPRGIPVAELRGSRPAIVVTFGMNYNRTPGIFETAIEALGGEPVDVVVTVGINRDPAELEPLPPNVRAVRYVPLSVLLSRADVTLCHGGFNTVMASVWAGTPLVLVPIDSDQPMQAERCVELGLGQRVDHRELSPENIRAAVRTVRGDAGYRRATAEFRAELESLPSAADAADLLQRLATDRRPVLADDSAMVA